MLGGFTRNKPSEDWERNSLFPLYDNNGDFDPAIHSMCPDCRGFCRKAQIGGHVRGCPARLEKKSAEKLEHDQRRSHSYHGNKGKAYSTQVHGADSGSGRKKGSKSKSAERADEKSNKGSDKEASRSRNFGSGRVGERGSETAARAHQEAEEQEAASKTEHFDIGQDSGSQGSRSTTQGAGAGGNYLPPNHNGKKAQEKLDAENRHPKSTQKVVSETVVFTEEGLFFTEEQLNKEREEKQDYEEEDWGEEEWGEEEWGDEGWGDEDWDEDPHYSRTRPSKGWGKGKGRYGSGAPPPPPTPKAFEPTIQEVPHDDVYEGLKMPNWTGLLYYEDDQLRTGVPYEVFKDLDESRSVKDIGKTINWPKIRDYRDMRTWSATYLGLMRMIFKYPGLKLVPQWWTQMHVKELLEVQHKDDQVMLGAHFMNTRPGAEGTMTMSNFLLSVCMNFPEKMRAGFIDIDAFLAVTVKPGKPLVPAMAQLLRVAQDAGVELNLQDPLIWRLIMRKIGIPIPVIQEARRGKGPTHRPSYSEVMYGAQKLKAGYAMASTSDFGKELLTVAPAKMEHIAATRTDDILCYNVEVDQDAAMEEMKNEFQAFCTGIAEDIEDLPDSTLQACVLNLKTLQSYQYNPAAPQKGKGKSSKKEFKPKFRNPRNTSTFRSIFDRRKGKRSKFGKGRKGKGKSKNRKRTQAYAAELETEEELDWLEPVQEEWEQEEEHTEESIQANLAALVECEEIMEVFYAFLPMSWRCLRCGEPGHQAKECKKDENACWACGKTGHSRLECKASEAEKEAWDKKIRLSLKNVKAMVAHIEEELDQEEAVESGGEEDEEPNGMASF